MAASAHADGQIEFTGNADCAHNVRDAGGPDDHRWFGIDHPAPDSPGHLIFRIARSDRLALLLRPQCGQINLIPSFGLAIHESRLTRSWTEFA